MLVSLESPLQTLHQIIAFRCFIQFVDIKESKLGDNDIFKHS